MRLMTDNYSQWYSYHVKNKGKHAKVEAEDTCLEDESISDNLDKHVAKRPRIDSDTTVSYICAQCLLLMISLVA